MTALSMNRSLASETLSAAESSPNLPPDKPFFKNFSFWAFLIVLFGVLVSLGYHNGVRSLFYSIVTFFEVVAIFNVLIIVHELGHFLAARWCGLQVDKFAIWFGKPLWSKKIDGVEYILGTIPAGGYVALPQMANPESLEGKAEIVRDQPLPPASPFHKIIVAFAGPLFSFGLAVVFAVMVWIVGKPVSDAEKTTTIGFVVPGGPADKAGLHAGDVIKSIANHSVTRWTGVPDGVAWRIITSTGEIPVVVERAGQTLSLQVTPLVDLKEHHWYQRGVPPRIQIAPAEKDFIIGKVLPNSPAAYAGLQKGDRITAIGGEPIYAFNSIYQPIKDHPNDPVQLTVSRGGVSWPVILQPVRPVSPSDIPKDEPQTDIGIEFDGTVGVVMDHPLPWNQVIDAANTVRSTLAALLAPHSRVGASQLSGPIGIMNIFGIVLGTENGWRLALWIAVIINVNLAMLNLLPFPILDGGHILLSIIEWLRRRPLSMAILEPLQTACAAVLISYMVYVTFFDAQDSFKMATGGDGEMKFAPRTNSP